MQGITSDVAIVMATYNGEKYIEEQVESLQKQTYPHWKLFISDDMSSDRTVNIVKRLCETDKRISLLKTDKNLGVTLNFLNALETVFNLNQFDYFMFSDQDDVWMPDKIELTIKYMKEQEKNADIVLVHTDLRVVDETAQTIICESYKRFAGLKNIEENVFERLLAQPFVFGCTVMINKELVKRLFPIPANVYAHDSWASLVAAGLGKVAYLNVPTISYRQHNSNASGGTSEKSFINRIKRVTIGWKKQIDITRRRVKQCSDLLDYLEKGTMYYDILEKYCLDIRQSSIKAIKTSIQQKILRQGFFANVLYFITIFFIERKNDVRECV
ncbi:MAG: glycosyltransferase family 2 protein [Christensenellales bacterium]|jgi:glycosyltransferase involved in cell wall biosynthesis